MSTSAGKKPAGTILLQNRYKVSFDHQLGEGAYSYVYKGLDTKDRSRNVAVKIFKESPTKSGQDEAFKLFVQGVDVMNLLSSITTSAKHASEMSMGTRASFNTAVFEEAPATDGDFEATEVVDVMSHMDLRKCFVQILGHSTDSKGNPGIDTDTEKLFIITEYGEESMDHFLERRRDEGTPLNTDELRLVHWSLVTIVCGLHFVGYVHLDLKPMNIMRVKDTWRLIDFDGAVKTRMPLGDSFAFTPVYMAPEVAEMILGSSANIRSQNGKLVTSRLMDVWSLGMCAIEAVFLQPILEPWRLEWLQDSGSDVKFFEFLCEYEAEPIVSGDFREALEDISPDMADLMMKMLQRDPAKRSCIADCLMHPWFSLIRDAIWHNLSSDHMTAANTAASANSARSRSTQRSTLLSVPSPGGLKCSPVSSGSWQPTFSKATKSKGCSTM